MYLIPFHYHYQNEHAASQSLHAALVQSVLEDYSKNQQEPNHEEKKEMVQRALNRYQSQQELQGGGDRISLMSNERVKVRISLDER